MLHFGPRLTTRRRASAVVRFTAAFSAQVAHDSSAGPLGFVAITDAQGTPSLVDGEIFGVSGSAGGLFTVTETAGFILVDFDRNGLGDAFFQGQSLTTEISVRITDSVTERTVPLTLTVARANTAPVASGALADLELPRDTPITPVDVSGDFSDPGDTLSFAATGLPAGLVLSGGGLLTGTPSEIVSGQVVTVTATDSIGQQAMSAFQITVTASAGAATDPNINAIGDEGWRVDYTAPGTFDPVGNPKYLIVERSGFDANGSAVNIPEALFLTSRVREPYPNQLSVTPGDVSLSDFVYGADVVNGVTNGSTRIAPLPQAMWLNHDREWATGVTHTVRLAVAHAHARSGRPVASVRFTATDETGNTTSVTVSTMSVRSYSGSGLSVPHFAAALDLSGLVQGELVTVDATIFPWVGEAFTLSTDADPYPSSNLTVLTFLNDRSGGYGTTYAYVDGVGAAPAAHMDAATAATTPFATVAAAASAILSYNVSNHGRTNASGGIIRLQPGVHTHGSFSSVAVGEIPLIVEAADPAQKAGTVYRDAGNSTSNSIPDRLKFRNVTLRRNATGSAIFLDNNASTGDEHMLVTEGCIWDDNGLGPSWGAWLYKVGRFWNIDCSGDDCGQCVTFSSVFKTAMAIGSGNGSIGTATYHAAGCKDLDGVFALKSEASHRPASIGDFLGWCHIGNSVNSVRCVNFQNQMIGDRGAAVVGCVLEQYGGTTGPCLFVSADSDVSAIDNVVLHCNTIVGSRSNLAYQDTGSTRVNKALTQRFCVHQSRNTKSDIFGANGNLVGNWPVIYQVGCSGNTAIEGSADGSPPGIGSWMGEIPCLGGLSGSQASPLNADWLDDRSVAGVGGGDGLYVPGIATELPLIPTGISPYSHDQLGKAIANDGTARIGALQP